MDNAPRILITRSREQAAGFADALHSIGAHPVFLPTIEITPVEDPAVLDRSLAKLNCFDWLIFTSANAVDAFFNRQERVRIELPLDCLQIAVIGPKTAAALKARGFTPHFMPDEYIAEALTPGLGDLNGKWVLIPTSDIAHKTLQDAIRAAGGFAHVVAAYHTRPADPDSDGLDALRSGVDVITFTSGSTVRNFHRMVDEAGMDALNLPGEPLIACIGPKTAAEAGRVGYRVDILSDPYTVQGLVEAIQKKLSGIKPYEYQK